MSDAFSKLSPPIQQVLWSQRWNKLREIQVDSIHCIRDTTDDLIISAATASGKTEAAFLPILSKLTEQEDQQGVKALYIAPLKALINDQHIRLKELLTYSTIEVHRWHGDVSATDKKKLRAQPSGILQITPESLESCFINYGNRLHDIFSNLEFVIIDELHAFLGDVRGVHLSSLLSRLKLVAKNPFRIVGLSATLSDLKTAQNYINPKQPASVQVVKDASGSRLMHIGLRAYPHPTAPQKNNSKSTKEDISTPEGVAILADELARVFTSHTNLIFSNSRSLAELLTDHLGQLAKKERWTRDPFAIHHGSLSKELREDVEKRLKKGESLSVFCTSTLEMGLDIGNVHSVGQLSPPWSVASLVQRVGRSGRKEGDPAILRMYALDKVVTEDAALEDRISPQLIRSIALIELMLENWLEPQPSYKLQISTFIQQVLSILRQTGGSQAQQLYSDLITNGVFSEFSVDEFKSILKELSSQEIIEQMPEGTIILTPKGEKITHDRSFYAAFEGSEDFSIRYQEATIGTLPSTSLPPVGEHFILGGKRWSVDYIESSSRIVDVKPSRAKKPVLFTGASGEIHTQVVQKMASILQSEDSYVYLHKDAQSLLTKARKIYQNANLGLNSCIRQQGKTVLFPWLGTRALITLALCAKLDGIKCEMKNLCLIYHVEISELAEHMKRITSKKFSAKELADILPDKHPEKYDEYAPPELLNKVNSIRCISIDEVYQIAKKISIF